jgi:3',5'-cyclic AMP phosphodiesterase CpdA
VPTNEQLAQSVAHINSLDPLPDAMIASGDLTDHGRPQEYDLLREILSDLIPPVFVIPGNQWRRLSGLASKQDARKQAKRIFGPQKLGTIAAIPVLGGLHHLIRPELGFD